MDRPLLIKLRVERAREIQFELHYVMERLRKAQIDLEEVGADEVIQVIEDLITRLMHKYWELVKE